MGQCVEIAKSRISKHSVNNCGCYEFLLGGGSFPPGATPISPFIFDRRRTKMGGSSSKPLGLVTIIQLPSSPDRAMFLASTHRLHQFI